MNDELWLIDSNILVYGFDSSDERQKKAGQLIEECTRGKRKLAISLQNLTELFYGLTRKVPQKLTPSEAAKIITLFIEHNNWIKLIPKETTLLAAMKFVSERKVQFWDAMIAAVMLENNIHKIITEDQGFAQIPGIVVKNPFVK